MKVFYVFNIRKEFKSLYQNNPSVLYGLLKQIYNLDKENSVYAYSLYDQIVKVLDKRKLDNYLFIKLHQEIPYSKRKNIHIMNNLYRNEISRLIVKNSYIKIECESSNCSFFYELKKLHNFFVCDFKNSDFFFLNGINTCNNY